MDTDKLKNWFLTHKRELPWRKNPSPYEVWISEVMLQQTQVSVVIDYYDRWMELFPTIEVLANASLEEVIKAWEGLGYYSRARRLHEAARAIVQLHQGVFPDKTDILKAIPGLGPYTVNAILSFAFHQKAAAVDGNVIRVIARYKALKDDVTKVKTIDKIRSYVLDILPDKEPWVVMEALIEFGATLCKKKPECGKCPLRLSCKAYEDNAALQYPVKEQKCSITRLYRRIWIIEADGYVLAYQEKDKKKRMADLWEFPFTDKDVHQEDSMPCRLQQYFHKPLQYRKEFPMVKQSFTRYQAYLYPKMWTSVERPDIPGYRWLEKGKLAIYPFSSGHKRIMQFLMLNE